MQELVCLVAAVIGCHAVCWMIGNEMMMMMMTQIGLELLDTDDQQWSAHLCRLLCTHTPKHTHTHTHSTRRED